MRISLTHFREKHVFLKLAHAIIFIHKVQSVSGKRQSLQNRIFRFGKAPWSSPGAGSFHPALPRSLPKATFKAKSRPESSHERPRAFNSRIEFTKLACSKPFQYLYLTCPGISNNAPGPPLNAPSTPPGPSTVDTIIPKGGPRGRPRNPQDPGGAP